MTDLVDRLLKRKYTCAKPPYDRYLVNPDGPEAASRISQQDAELERLRRELADMTISRDGYAKQAMAREAEGRRKAFIEAAEIAEETAQGSDHLLKAAGQAKDIQGALVHGEGVMTARIIATALRRKAEETGHE